MRSEEEIKAKISELEKKMDHRRELFSDHKIRIERMEVLTLDYHGKMAMLEWVLGEEIEAE